MDRNINYESLFNDMIDFTIDYIIKNKRASTILGVSGGIDSTVVSALLYEVRKKLYLEHKYVISTIGYSLPTNTTNDKEYFVSTLVGNAFMTNFITRNINDLSTSISDFFINGNNTCNEINAFRRGNIKSRLRMMFLYDAARYNHGFVVGTDNYTEKLLGFSTIGGDALADYMPLQYLWKTEVYGLANYLLEKYKKEENWSAVNAINESIKLTPQDGLGISTSDMVQIGARNYFDVDDILYSFEKMNVSYETFLFSKEYSELCEKFSSTVVEKVLRRRVNNFKLNLPLEFKPNL